MVDFLLYQCIEGEYTMVPWIPVVGLFFVEFCWVFCAQNISQRFPQKRDSTPTFWLDEVLGKMTPPESERTVGPPWNRDHFKRKAWSSNHHFSGDIRSVSFQGDCF